MHVRSMWRLLLLWLCLQIFPTLGTEMSADLTAMMQQHLVEQLDHQLRLTEESHQANQTEMAIVTHICDATWAPGAIALAASLKRAGSKYDLVLMITNNFGARHRALFAQVFDKVYVEEPLKQHPVIVRPGADCVTLQLRSWQLPYAKILYMDSDMIAVKSHDSLLETSVELSARVDVGLQSQFNSGMLVLEPSESKFQMLRKLLATMRQQKRSLGGIQFFLNQAFPSCQQPGEVNVGCWRGRISEEYNKYTRDVSFVDLETRKYASLHYSGDWGEPKKPWMSGCHQFSDSSANKDYQLREKLLHLWREVFHSISVSSDLADLLRTDCEAEADFNTKLWKAVDVY